MRLSRLKDVRERAALTQRELAEKSGVAHPTLNRIELGKQEPRISTVRMIAKALGVKPAALMEPAAK